MWDRYTKAAKGWVGLAQREADLCDTHYVEAEHFLLALLHDGDGDPALAVLERITGGTAGLRADAECQCPRAGAPSAVWPPPPQAGGYADSSIVGEAAGGEPPDFRLSASGLKLAKRAAAQAHAMGDKHIGTEHYLLGLVADSGPCGSLLAAHSVTWETVRAAFTQLQRQAVDKAAPSRRRWLKWR